MKKIELKRGRERREGERTEGNGIEVLRESDIGRQKARSKERE